METLRTELNSNEKLALSLTGMEGTGEHFILNGETADQILLREKQEKIQNDYIDILYNDVSFLCEISIFFSYYLLIFLILLNFF